MSDGRCQVIKSQFRIVLAAVIFSSLLCLAYNNIPAAFRALNTRSFQNTFCVAAFGEPGAGKELAVRAILNDHLTAALIADNIGNLILDLDLFKLLPGLIDRSFKVRVENCGLRFYN